MAVLILRLIRGRHILIWIWTIKATVYVFFIKEWQINFPYDMLCCRLCKMSNGITRNVKTQIKLKWALLICVVMMARSRVSPLLVGQSLSQYCWREAGRPPLHRQLTRSHRHCRRRHRRPKHRKTLASNKNTGVSVRSASGTTFYRGRTPLFCTSIDFAFHTVFKSIICNNR